MATELQTTPKTGRAVQFKNFQTEFDSFMENSVKDILPRGVDLPRFKNILLNVVRTNPDFLDADRKSLFNSALLAAKLGLEPDPELGQIYFIKRKDKIVAQLGYIGQLELIRRSGVVSSVQAKCVYEGDVFDYELGLNDKLSFKPVAANRAHEKLTHVWLVVKYTNGGYHLDVLTRGQVEAVRDGSDGWKAFKRGAIKDTPWNSSFSGMAIKTIIRANYKFFPKSSQLVDTIKADADFTSPDSAPVNYDTETGEVFDTADGATIEHVTDVTPVAEVVADDQADFLPPAAPSKLTEKMKAAM
jgi:recombination protein RecT